MDIHDDESEKFEAEGTFTVPNDRGSIQEINSKINEKPTLRQGQFPHCVSIKR
jgi:hypothetical protein